MKPPRDLLKIRRHLAKVPVKPTVEDELASALSLFPTNNADDLESAIEEREKALARYRASKTK